MVQTISWMVTREEPASRARISGVILRWFLAGGLAGGAVAGVIVAGAARLIYIVFGDELRFLSLAAAAVAIAYLGRMLGLWRVPKPQIAQQVPSSWRDVLPPRVASFLYAGTLGLTFFTRVGSLALFPMLVLALGLGRWPLAVISLFAIAGLIRAATALIVPLFDWVDDHDSLIFSALKLPARVAQKLEAGVLAAVAGLLLIAAAIT